MGSPCGPAPTVAEYVVKNFSRPGVVIFTAPSREAFCVSGWLDYNSGGEIMQVFSIQSVAQSLRDNISQLIFSQKILHQFRSFLLHVHQSHTLRSYQPSLLRR